MRLLTMLKKEAELKWNNKAKQAVLSKATPTTKSHRCLS